MCWEDNNPANRVGEDLSPPIVLVEEAFGGVESYVWRSILSKILAELEIKLGEIY